MFIFLAFALLFIISSTIFLCIKEREKDELYDIRKYCEHDIKNTIELYNLYHNK